jgi:hypothetical protein
MKDVTLLSDGWGLRHEDAVLPARVPGCVHTDLLTAGLIPDPFLGTNEHDVAWVGDRAWTYTTRSVPPNRGWEASSPGCAGTAPFPRTWQYPALPSWECVAGASPLLGQVDLERAHHPRGLRL